MTRRTRKTRWLLALVTLVGGGLWAMRGRFRQWTLAQLRRVRRGSRRRQTEVGAVEFQRVGTGPVVLIVHGAPGGSDSWRIFATIRNAGFTLLTPSRPGYLRTPVHAGQTFPEQAAMLVALLDALAINEVVVVGSSLGGPAALELAWRYPARVRGLVLVGAMTHRYALDAPIEDVVVGSSWIPRRAQWAVFWVVHRFMQIAPRLSTRAVIWAGYNGPDDAACAEAVLNSPIQRRALVQLVESSVPLRHRQRGYDNDVRALRQWRGVPLSEIATPTFVLHSRHDASVPFRHAEVATEQIPRALLSGTDGCGHYPFLGPGGDTLVQEMIAFIEQCHA